MSVKIRIKRGYVYLDILADRAHHWEALHIKLSKEPAAREEQLRIAEMCRAKRELQLAADAFGISEKDCAEAEAQRVRAELEKAKQEFGIEE